MRRLSDDKRQHILLLGSRGLPQKNIAEVVGVSVGAVNKILKAAPSPPPVDDAAEVPEELPEGVDLATVDKWIPRVEQAIEAARAGNDFNAMSSLMAKLVALLEHKRKATPAAKPDPNEHPDMIEAAKRVRERWFKLLDGLAGK